MSRDLADPTPITPASAVPESVVAGSAVPPPVHAAAGDASAMEPRFASRRQRELINYVRTYGTGQVNELARVLGVSASTVRRDMIELQDQGLLERLHGGAIAAGDAATSSYPLRSNTHTDEKHRIAARAADLVRDRSTILVLSGTTTEAMLPHLSLKNELTVVTNSLVVVNRLAQYPDIEIVVLGGVLWRKEMAALGALTIAALAEFGIDQVFCGAFGLDAENGVTRTNLNEVQTDRSMMTAASNLVVMADHSKFLQRGPARLVPTSAITTLVTDTGADPAIVAGFRAAGVDVITA
ncbi:MAG: hypothetical protein JWQ43_735 [Glaciihabitans sp.]|nr:hypothetical protein [Glaciihabitans sp.]